MWYCLEMGCIQSVPHLYSPCSDSSPSVQSMSRMFLASASHVQRVPDCTARVQYIPFYSPYPDSTDYLKPCQVMTPSLQPISSPYVIFKACVQTVPVCLQHRSSLYLIFTTHVYCINADITPFLQYLYSPCLVSTPYLLSHAQSVHHLSWSCPVSTPSLLPMSSQQTISSTHVPSEYISCPLPVRVPSLLLMYIQYIISCPHPVRIPHLCPCPIRLPSLLPLSSQNTTFSHYVQSVIISGSQIQSV